MTDTRVACSFIFILLSHFQTNSVKFQIFEIIHLHVCTKFRGNWLRDFGFRTRKPPKMFRVKSDLIQKRFKYGKKYFKRLYVLRYPFIPTNPFLAAIRFFCVFFSLFSCFSFCFLFFFLILVHSSSKPQNTKI